MFFCIFNRMRQRLPMSGICVNWLRMRFLLPYQDALARRCLKYSDSAPTFFEMDISLSLRMTMSPRMAVARVIHRLVTHAARQRAVADNRHHMIILMV